MIQALVLMGLYTFLPMVTFLSGFNLKVLFSGAVAIFTVKLWASMWFIATWIDGHLINAMYPGALSNIFVQEAMMVAKGAVPPSYKRMILNTLLVMLFIGLPMLWSTMLTWAGIRISDGIDRLMSQYGGNAANSGRSSIGAVTGGAKFGKR